MDHQSEPLRIVLASSEAVPFSKTGGLADVVGALARTFGRMRHETVLIVPDYYGIRQSLRNLPEIHETGLQFTISMAGQPVAASVNWTTLPGSGVRVLLIRQPEYFDRPQLYQEHGHGYTDNCARFCFFSRAVLEVCRQMLLRPDVLHCNDWQTGIIPGLLRTQYSQLADFRHTASVLTLHNMAFQGRFWHFDMPLTGMDWRYFNYHFMEAWGDLNLLKTGIAFADQITTVSPSYAREICQPEEGCGLEGILHHRRDDLVGILNGIDADIWNPETDSLLPARYSLSTLDRGKPQCKTHLQRRMKLPQRSDVPLLGMVSRISDQKGFDLIFGASERLLHQDIQLVFLGSGDPGAEAQLRALGRQHPQKVAVEIGFDDSLAHQIEAGSDMFLMPSRFEPCGLNQMYSLRYGTVPIVRKVGGLADTVINLEPDGSTLASANGFVFTDYSQTILAETVERAICTWKNPPVWHTLIRNGMTPDWSWDSSARKYLDVYQTARRKVAERESAVGR